MSTPSTSMRHTQSIAVPPQRPVTTRARTPFIGAHERVNRRGPSTNTVDSQVGEAGCHEEAKAEEYERLAPMRRLIGQVQEMAPWFHLHSQEPPVDFPHGRFAPLRPRSPTSDE